MDQCFTQEHVVGMIDGQQFVTTARSPVQAPGSGVSRPMEPKVTVSGKKHTDAQLQDSMSALVEGFCKLRGVIKISRAGAG